MEKRFGADVQLGLLRRQRTEVSSILRRGLSKKKEESHVRPNQQIRSALRPGVQRECRCTGAQRTEPERGFPRSGRLALVAGRMGQKSPGRSGAQASETPRRGESRGARVAPVASGKPTPAPAA